MARLASDLEPAESSARRTGSRPATLEDLLGELRAEEHQLSAVDRFARWHEDAPPIASPRERYRHLLPATPPAPHQQYAFEVDLDACSGCKACVTACHSLNGLEPGESWRRVHHLLPLTPRSPNSDLRTPNSTPRTPHSPLPPPLPDLRSPIHATAACHHCLEPACSHGCPVLAYDKDPRTGIVRHLDDQCIGCSYCTWMCPYEVPRYSARLGIVRKCDLCTDRLAVGEAPACAQACPNEAIRISLVDTRERREHYAAFAATAERPHAFLPATPDPRITLPSSIYRTHRSLGSGLQPAEASHQRPAPAHAPLVFLLVLTQAGLGTLISEVPGWLRPGDKPATHTSLLALLLVALGLGISALHLGQPAKAWRSFLGWRRSWLSREALALSAFLGLTALHAAAVQPVFNLLPFAPLTALLAIVVGAAGVYASARVYSATRRHCWSEARVLPDFVGTVLLAAFAVAASQPQSSDLRWGMILAVVLLLGAKLKLDTNHWLLFLPRPESSSQGTANPRNGTRRAVESKPRETPTLVHPTMDTAPTCGNRQEAQTFGHSLASIGVDSPSNPTVPLQPSSSRRAEALLQGPLRRAWIARVTLACAGVAALALANHGGVPPWIAVIGAIAMLASELLSRVLFFRTSAPDPLPASP